MDNELNNEKIRFDDVLLDIGFRQINADRWQFDFGNLKLDAWRTCEWLYEVIKFYGIYYDKRSIGEVKSTQSAYVDCFEQGVAIVAYVLRNYELHRVPTWLEEGLANEDLLPWMTEIVAFRNIPKAHIDQDYFRLLVKKLKYFVENYSVQTQVTFSFDGEAFKVVCGNDVILAPAKGKKWEQQAVITLNQLRFPKRIRYNSYSMYIRENKFYFGDHAIDLMPPLTYPRQE